jgi:ribosomal 50S subunit-associated protein YjgA (DUF615 family)
MDTCHQNGREHSILYREEKAMANNSLTERVLSANERGLTVDEICAYENLPLEDVEHILRYWKSEYHAGTRRRQMKVDDFIRRRGATSLQEFVERVSQTHRAAVYVYMSQPKWRSVITSDRMSLLTLLMRFTS